MRKAKRLLRKAVQGFLPGVSAYYRQARDYYDYTRNARVECSYSFAGHEYRFHGPRLKAQFAGREVSGELLAMQTLLAQDIEVFVDVGANLGVFSLLACQVATGPRMIVSLEPCARNFELLVRNASLQKTDREIICLHLAAAARSGFEELRGGIEGASLLEGWGDVGATYCEMVQTLPLDRLLELLGCTNKKLLVKVDAEGGEPGILDGAAKTIAQGSASLVVELSLHENHASPDFDGYLAVFDKMFAQGMWARTFPGLKTITRKDVLSWVGKGDRQDTRLTERTLNIVFEPRRGEG
jgi:FkbM family methyltransferase